MSIKIENTGVMGWEQAIRKCQIYLVKSKQRKEKKMIKQIINSSQIVQTGLAVEVDGIRVDYRRIPGKFAYKFTVSVMETLDLNLIEAAIDQIVGAMCDQSFDHGSEWRETGIRTTSFDPRTEEYTVTVYFRIKDSY